MKTMMAWIICCLIIPQNLKCQDSAKIKTPIAHLPVYKAKLHFAGKKSVGGLLMSIRDSFFFMSGNNRTHDPFHKANIYDESTWVKYDYRLIESIKIINRKAKVGPILICTGIGIAAGAIIGYSQGDDPPGLFAVPAGTKALAGGVAGGGIGAILGAIIAQTVDKEYIIDGEWKKLEVVKEVLKYR